MPNQTGARRGTFTPTRPIMWWAVLITCVVGAVMTAAAAPNLGATYRWHGELVALDEAAGTVTVKSPAADPAGLAALKDARAGDPILITWSGAGNRASGIRMAAPYVVADIAAVAALEAVESGTDAGTRRRQRKIPSAFCWLRRWWRSMRTLRTSPSRRRCPRRASKRCAG